MKKLPSKVAHNWPNFFFSIANWPKLGQISDIFHRNLQPRDFYILTLFHPVAMSLKGPLSFPKSIIFSLYDPFSSHQMHMSLQMMVRVTDIKHACKSLHYIINGQIHTNFCRIFEEGYTVGFWCQTIHVKFLRRFDTIFSLKMMVKSGLEKIILKFNNGLQSCCCPVQKNLPRKAELARQISRYL